MPAEWEYMGKLCVAQTVIAWAFLQTTVLQSIAAKQTLQKQPLFNLISSGPTTQKLTSYFNGYKT